jgi:hypothetical protein
MRWQGQVLEFNQVHTSASTYSVMIDTSSGDISDKNSSGGSSTNSDESEGDVDDGVEGPERPTKRARKLPVRHYIQVATTMFSGDIY